MLLLIAAVGAIVLAGRKGTGTSASGPGVPDVDRGEIV